MERKLYPLKFKPILKDKIWGGNKLNSILKKNDASDKCGESWEISGVEGNVSVVSNGFLEGNSLEELIEIYMDELVGDKVFKKFGVEFPLLIKFIDANDKLSIQVHPDDEMAYRRHKSFGKTEMWYVVQAEKEAELISGFKTEVKKDEYRKAVANGELEKLLNYEKVKEGDIFFIPAGRVHAIGAGILLAEIQQTSDVTYRIYDFNRKDSEGNLRELHTELATDAIDYSAEDNYKTNYNVKKNETAETVSCKYFSTNVLEFDSGIKKDYARIDSFVIYICTKGKFDVFYGEDEPVCVMEGETVLVPAYLNSVLLNPVEETKILEVFIKS